MLNDQQFGDLHRRLTSDGGFTVNVHTGQHATAGWAVAQPGLEHKGSTSAGPEAIKSYHDQNRGALASAGHLGGWHDPMNNETFLDTTKLHPSTPAGTAHAIAEGYKNRQLSVYNLGTGHTLTMRPGESSDMRDARDDGHVSPAAARVKAIASPSFKPEQKANRQAMRAARGGMHTQPVSSMKTSDLAAALRNRGQV